MVSKTRLKEINLEIKKLEKIIDKKEKKFDFGAAKSFKEYEEMREPESALISKLDREKRLLQDYKLSELDKKYGDIMSVEEFITSVKDGWFIDYDGYGRYVKDGKESNITILPSDVEHNSVRKDFDKVIWFNR